LAGSGLSYRAGDALGVWPLNHFELVDSLVISCNAHGGETVTLSDGQLISFRAALLTKLDLFRPQKALLEALFGNAPSQGDRRRLRELLSEEGETERTELLGGSDVLDILRAFPTARLDPQKLVEQLRKIAPRLYSISSSPLAHPNEVHLTVGIQRTQKNGRMRYGAASSFLASRVPLGLPVNVFVQPSGHFHPPEDPSKDLILCGPGTGIAPFRGFLHERAASGATGRNWLFFGDQRQEMDFLYRDEILELRGKGVLHELDLAFSRDQDEKVYVQTRMVERAKDLWAWLEGGATFCVCGDAKRMAKDVDAALKKVCEIGGGLSTEQAETYVAKMTSDHRYLRDVY
jgi:sulfite reductase (NADPH) flavoprotein alpha-component